jgi:hypothetical protein
MKIVAPESGKFQLPEPGDHTATLKSYEDLGFQPDIFNSGKEKHQVKLTFELEGGLKQVMWVNATLHPMSKFYGIAAALLGENPPKALEMEELIGLTCTVTIERYKNNKGQDRSKIADVRRSRR